MINSKYVYIVDDDISIRFLLCELLSSEGYVTSTYESAESLVAQRDFKSPGVIILDMKLPGLSGIELQQKLLSIGISKPIIFVSGNSQHQEIIDAMKQGAFDFIFKPFDINDLLSAVRRAIDYDRNNYIVKERVLKLKKSLIALTIREKDILRYLVQGYANREISSMTGIQPGTVKKHKSSILQKMNVVNVADLIKLFKDIDIDLF